MGRQMDVIKINFVVLVVILLPISAFAGTCWNGGSSGSSPWYVLDRANGDPSCAFVDVNY